MKRSFCSHLSPSVLEPRPALAEMVVEAAAKSWVSNQIVLSALGGQASTSDQSPRSWRREARAIANWHLRAKANCAAMEKAHTEALQLRDVCLDASPMTILDTGPPVITNYRFSILII